MVREQRASQGLVRFGRSTVAWLAIVFVLAILLLDMFGFWVMGDLMAGSMWWVFFFFIGVNLLVLGILAYSVLAWDPVKVALRRRVELERKD